MSVDADIKGMWEGSYSYSSTDEIEATQFKARLSENASGEVTGIAIEDHLRGVGQVKADLNGGREGRIVRFTKRYVEAGSEYGRAIKYEGELSADGQVIEGRWMLPDDSGTFVMRRA